MTELRKILGQSAPAASVLTDVYTVGASTQAVISTLTISNRSITDTNFRVSVAQNGAADATKQYIYYDVFIPANDTFATTIGITLNAGDVIRFLSGNGNLSINIFGVELI